MTRSVGPLGVVARWIVQAHSAQTARRHPSERIKEYLYLMQPPGEPTQPKPWRERANTLGYLTGGSDAQVSVLRQILTQMPCNGKDTLRWKSPEGKEISATCGALCRSQLLTSALIERVGADEWAPTKAAVEWLQNDDISFLACHIHTHVKFFGEMLAAIGKDTSQVDLLHIARTSYGMNWETPDQVHRRTAWLRSLGLIEVWGQKKIVRTPAGDSFLNLIQLCPPDEAIGVEAEDDPVSIADDIADFISVVSDLDQESLRGRRALIGYIPRGINSAGRDDEEVSPTPTAALRRLLKICGAGLSIEEFMDLCAQELGINKSSFNSMLHTLRHMGLVEQTQFNFYSPTSNAAWLVEAGNEKALVAHLHGRYGFIGEILINLDAPASPSQLVKISKERYGYKQASNGEIRVRLGFLQDAGLVARVDWQRFRITTAGKNFASILTLQQDVSETTLEEANGGIESAPRSGDVLAEIVEELKSFSEDGNESKAFEAAISRAFRFLGFHTDHLGGSGQTDVLAVAELTAKDRYRLIIDAKSSSNGTIPESAVNFDVLRDHKRKHKADYVIVVAPDFANRLKDWAVENDVVLLQAVDLARILERHSSTPIPLVELRDTFTR